jgi:catechol 2,3-dioxygenase-like lactoylglutathione lyase family enzyme
MFEREPDTGWVAPAWGFGTIAGGRAHSGVGTGGQGQASHDQLTPDRHVIDLVREDAVMTSLSTATPIAFIQTADSAASRQFYAETLALPLGPQDDFATVYDLAGVILRVTTIAGYTAGPHPVLGWRVADIAATVAALTVRGVRFTVYDGFGQDDLGIWTAPDGGARVAWFNDPDGNVLSLTQS